MQKLFYQFHDIWIRQIEIKLFSACIGTVAALNWLKYVLYSGANSTNINWQFSPFFGPKFRQSSKVKQNLSNTVATNKFLFKYKIVVFTWNIWRWNRSQKFVWPKSNSICYEFRLFEGSFCSAAVAKPVPIPIWGTAVRIKATHTKTTIFRLFFDLLQTNLDLIIH